jgi:adenylate cyclase
MQDEIAESVVASLRGSLLSQREKKLLSRPQTGTAAYEYYLRGRQHLAPMTEPDLQKSAELFSHAIELDPNYGPAYAGLAMVHATLHEWFGAGEEGLAKAEAASARALELSPNLAESHVARGCTLALSRQYDAAGSEFREAIRLNPHLFEAYYYYGRTSFAAGDVARSADLFRDAADARQEDYQSLLLMEQSLRILGKTEESAKEARRGIRRAERALMLNPRDARALSLGSGSLYHLGEIERAIDWCERSLEIDPDDISSVINAACLQANMGNKEGTLKYLERIFSSGRGKRDWIEHDTDYDLVRDDPRFQRLLEKLS